MYMDDYKERIATDHWRAVCGYDCMMNNRGEILYLLDEHHERKYLWKPANGGLDAIPYCTVSRFRQGIKRGSVVIR